MIVSDARLAANRANAQKSTGPKTAEGKERSRANAYRHGMTGAGVVLPAEDAAEVERRSAVIRAEMQPRGEVQEALAHRAALLSVRLDRCALHEAAAVAARVRNAVPDFDEAREAEVDRLMAAIEDDPATSVRKLRRTPEGVDRLIAAWLAIRSDVACAHEPRWGAEHRRLAENLTGRRPGDIGTSRVEALARAIRGDFTLLMPAEGGLLGDFARSAWARERMAELIDAEVAGLRAHRETLDLDAIAADRAAAPDLALFDPSKEATLARRYEAAAERGFFRALRELKAARAAEAGREPAPASLPAGPTPPLPPPSRPLASFSRPEPATPRPDSGPAPAASDAGSSFVPMAIGRPPARVS